MISNVTLVFIPVTLFMMLVITLISNYALDKKIKRLNAKVANLEFELEVDRMILENRKDCE